MTEKKVFSNIINGEERPAESGDTLDIINPSTGEVYATSPNSGPEDIDAAFQAAAAAFETYRWTTPSERQRFLLQLADVIEANAEELVHIESENTGKPYSLTLSDEIVPDGRPDPFLRRRRTRPGGESGRGVHEGLHVLHPQGAPRSGRSGSALELPHDDGGLEVRPSTGRRQHGCAQAIGRHARLVGVDGEEDAGDLPQGRDEPGLR